MRSLFSSTVSRCDRIEVKKLRGDVRGEIERRTDDATYNSTPELQTQCIIGPKLGIARWRSGNGSIR